MSKRHVKTVSSALSQTKKPVSVGDSRVGDGLENFVAGLGTANDKRSYTDYSTVTPLNRIQLEAMYRSSWPAKRLINMIADDMIGPWRDIQFGDADENPQLEALEQAETTYCIKDKFNAATRWGNLYGGCLMILGVGEASVSDDPKAMLEPLDVETVKKGDLRFLHVLDRWRCSPSGPVVTDMESPAYGMPVSYTIAESSVEIHYTRVIRFGGEALPYFEWLRNARWDDSLLQHTSSAIKDYESIAASIATMMFEANVDVIKTGDLTELLSTKDGETKLRKRFQSAAIMKSFNRTLLLSQEEEYEKKQNNFTNLKDIWEQSAVNLCAAADVPMTRFFGQSPGGLDATGDGDLQNYYKRIASDREKKLRPQLEYFDEIFVRSVLGSKPDDYTFEFGSLWETSEKDQATIEYQRAQRDDLYITNGAITPGLAASELKYRKTYSSMSNKDVKLAEELSESNAEFREASQEATIEGLQNPSGEEDSGAPAAKAKKSVKK